MTTMVKQLVLLVSLCSPAASFSGVLIPHRSGRISTTTLDVTREPSSSIQTSLDVSNVANGYLNDSYEEPSTAELTDAIVVCDLVGCAVADPNAEFSSSMTIDETSSLVDRVMNSYLGPRLLLAGAACLYGTNFPLGSIMDQAMPASAATSARMVLAALALSPFIFKLNKDLIPMALLAGCFTASGYVSQSLALVDTSPATVSFLGAATVIWCPFLEWLVDKKPMSWHDRPQTWIAGGLCMTGVGVLELCGASSEAVVSSIGFGDGLALMQAVGFGTGIFLSERMMRTHADQALPITAVLVATTAFISMLWCFADGWMGGAPGWESMTLPNLFFEPSLHEVAMAVIWTGLLSTSLNFFLEVFALGRVPTAEASVILATEPLWAAAFAAVILGESFGWNDYAGGFLIVAACLVNSLQTGDLQRMIGGEQQQEQAMKRIVGAELEEEEQIMMTE